MKTKEEKLKFLIEKMENLPPLSPTFSKIMKLVQDANASARDLTKVISVDPVLSANVIKLVNSAYFKPTERISSIVRAIIMLGIVTIKNLALSTALVGSFAKKKNEIGMNLDKFWIHSL